MFLSGIGKYQDVVSEDNNKVIKIFVEDVLYQMCEMQRGVGDTKSHHQKFIRSPTSSKCYTRYILIAYWHLPIS